MNPTADWQNTFVGREKELEILRQAWEKTVSGNPQVVVFLAESGLGKTRLIQEFYIWLSREDNVDSYWPDLLAESNNNSMNINPVFPRDWKPSQIPWLWWGIRCQNPGQRNMSEGASCAIISYLDKLVPHLEPVWKKRDKAMHRKSALFFAAKNLCKLAASLFPGVSTASSVMDIISDGKEAADVFKKEMDFRKGITLGIREIQDSKTEEASDLVFSSLHTILDESDRLAPIVPVVLVLDDAQWADGVTIDFFRKLLNEALLRKMSCLVLVTHWEREWNTNWEAEDDSAPETITGLIKSLVNSKTLSDGWEAIRLSTIPDMSEIIVRALPGISAEQRLLLLKKSGGNPLLLSQIIEWLYQKRDFFKERDQGGELTAKAEGSIRSKEFNIHDLVAERFSKLPDEVQEALGWSSEQGITFLEDLTACLLEKVEKSSGVSFTDIKSALKQAQYPVAMTQAMTSLMSEFKQTVFYEVAQDHVNGKDDRIQFIFRSALLEILIDWLYERHEKCNFGTLASRENESLLKLILRLLDPDNHEHDAIRELSLGKLVVTYVNQNLWLKAYEIASLLPDDFHKKDWLPSTESKSDSSLKKLFSYFPHLDIISNTQDHEPSEVFHAILGQLPLIRLLVENSGIPEEGLNTLLAALGPVPDAFFKSENNYKETIRFYIQIIEIISISIDRYGYSEERQSLLLDLHSQLDGVKEQNILAE